MRLLFTSWPPQGRILHAVPLITDKSRCEKVTGFFFFICCEFDSSLCMFSVVRASCKRCCKAVRHQVAHCQELFGVNRLLVISVCINLSSHGELHDTEQSNPDVVWVLKWGVLERGDCWQPTIISVFSGKTSAVMMQLWKIQGNSQKPHKSTSIAHSEQKISH